MMDTEELIVIFNKITDIFTNNDATIDDIGKIGYSLIVSAWRNDPDKEALIEPYINWFNNNFRKDTKEILKEEKENKE